MTLEKIASFDWWTSFNLFQRGSDARSSEQALSKTARGAQAPGARIVLFRKRLNQSCNQVFSFARAKYMFMWARFLFLLRV